MLQKDGEIVTELPYVCMWFFYWRDKQDYLVTWWSSYLPGDGDKVKLRNVFGYASRRINVYRVLIFCTIVLFCYVCLWNALTRMQDSNEQHLWVSTTIYQFEEEKRINLKGLIHFKFLRALFPKTKVINKDNWTLNQIKHDVAFSIRHLTSCWVPIRN